MSEEMAGNISNPDYLGKESPQELENYQTVAIPKPGKDPKMASSYRPISLLSMCYKLLERIILHRIYPSSRWNTKHRTSWIWAWKKHTGPSSSPYHLRWKWLSATWQNRSVFLDLTAAYDTVWHKGLLVKLSKVLPCWPLVLLNCSWDNGDFVSTWVTSAAHGGCRRMACHKDLFLHRLSSTCTLMLCQPHRAGSSFMPTSALPTRHTRLKI